MNAQSPFPPVSDDGQCTACGRRPGDWCRDCDGWPDYLPSPYRRPGSAPEPVPAPGPGLRYLQQLQRLDLQRALDQRRGQR